VAVGVGLDEPLQRRGSVVSAVRRSPLPFPWFFFGICRRQRVHEEIAVHENVCG